MDVGFRAVAGVPASADRVTDLDAVSHPNLCAAMLEMAECDHCTTALDHDVIAGERRPARAGTAALCQRIAERGQTSVGGMIEFEWASHLVGHRRRSVGWTVAYTAKSRCCPSMIWSPAMTPSRR